MKHSKKKISTYFCIAVLCLISVSGCSGQKESTPKPEQEQTQELETELQTVDETENEKKETIDLKNSFHGINGCAVLFDPQKNRYSFYNDAMCEQEVSPYSTFKIISTLMGLENGVIESTESTMTYNGTQYPISEWNENLNLQEAFQSSCIWYFRQVIDAVGEDEVKKELDALSYGNCDVSEWNGNSTNSIPELNGFWLNSSLKITPLQQVKMLARIFEGQSIYSDENISTLKEIMLVEDSGIQKIYGKTGSGSDQAWFVGFSEENNEKIYFAIFLDDNTQSETITGNTAKEIAIEILN